MRDIRRVQAEIRLLEQNYGLENVSWADNYDWLMITNFRLPPGCNRQVSEVLVWVPEHCGYGEPYMHFFVAAGLRLKCDGKLIELPHYFERFPYSSLDDTVVQQLREGGWSYLCIHPENWKTSDNIFTFLNQVYAFLNDPFRNWDEDSYGGHDRCDDADGYWDDETDDDYNDPDECYDDNYGDDYNDADEYDDEEE